jgi:hypothetical protein
MPFEVSIVLHNALVVSDGIGEGCEDNGRGFGMCGVSEYSELVVRHPMRHLAQTFPEVPPNPWKGLGKRARPRCNGAPRAAASTLAVGAQDHCHRPFE